MNELIEHLKNCFRPSRPQDYTQGWNNALGAALSHLESYNAWRKWPDQKPPKSGNYSVYGWNEYGARWVASETVHYDKNSESFDMSDFGESTVTHWQELPDLPEDV